MGTSGLMSGEWKRSEWRDIQTPATERAGPSYGPPSRHRATPRLHKLKGGLRRGILTAAKAARPRASPQRAVRAEPTPATVKRAAARRVFDPRAVWLRCSLSYRPLWVCAFARASPSDPWLENRTPLNFKTGSEENREGQDQRESFHPRRGSDCRKDSAEKPPVFGIRQMGRRMSKNFTPKMPYKRFVWSSWSILVVFSVVSF
jgi:hypothetical protein